MGTPVASRSRRPPAVAWVLLLAVLVGVAAALLFRPVGALGPAPANGGLFPTGQLGVVLAIVLFGGLGLWIFLMLRGNRSAQPPQAVVTILLAILLGVLFVEFAGFIHVTPLPTSGNGTGNSPPIGSGNNGSTNVTPSRLGTPGITLPAWAGFALIVGIGLLAAVFLVPYMVARADDRRRARSGAETILARQAQRALEQTLDRLQSPAGADARAAILALYSQLLHLVEPRLGALESRTPREIQQDSITTLGLRREVAEDLTEAFEEARYSTHPMTPQAVASARVALTEAIADLSTRAGVAT